jgi:hypothetical protein
MDLSQQQQNEESSSQSSFKGELDEQSSSDIRLHFVIQMFKHMTLSDHDQALLLPIHI